MKGKELLIYITVLLLLFACDTVRMSQSWQVENKLPEKYNKMLVLCLGNDSSTGLRYKMEKHLADDLKKLGYNAVTSLQKYGAGVFFTMEERIAIGKLKRGNFDAVITIVLLDKTKGSHYVQGRIFYTPDVLYELKFWNYYSRMYEHMITPGYYSENTRYFWESNLYNLRTGELVCSLQTESFDPLSTDKLAHEHGKLIARYLVSHNVIALPGQQRALKD